MRLYNLFIKQLGVYEKMKGTIKCDEVGRLYLELIILKDLCEQVNEGKIKNVAILGLKQEALKDICFSKFTYSALKDWVRHLVAESKVQGIFTILTADGECPLSDELFHELMENMDQMPSLVASEEDDFIQLIEKVNSMQGKENAEGGVPKSLGALISKLMSNYSGEEIYDPVIGTGSLAVQVAKQNKIKTIYGQEISADSINLCKSLLIACGMSECVEHIKLGDTLTKPQHWNKDKLRQFENIVAILPFGEYKRYPKQISNGCSETPFIYHVMNSLKEGGHACVLVSNGVLFREGMESKLREELIDKNGIEGIIQLPGKMLNHTAMATTLLLLKKNRVRQDILFMDLSGVIDKVSKRTTQLSEAVIDRAARLYHHYEASDISWLVPIEEIKDNGYNLSVKRYMFNEKEETNLNEVNDKIEMLEKQLIEIQIMIREKLQ